MEIAGIILLIALGFILLLIELLFIPGTTVVGVFGFLVTATGIYLTFKNFGDTAGYWTLTGSSVGFVVVLVIGFKQDTWSKVALKTSIDSKVNEMDKLGFSIDQEGLAVSDIKPVGKGEFDGVQIEVASDGSFIESGTPIVIQKILQNKIIVQQFNH